MLDSETAERREQMFGDLEKERDKLNGEVENLRFVRARVPLPAEELLQPAAGGAQAAPRPLASGEERRAPKRLRSILGEDDA